MIRNALRYAFETLRDTFPPNRVVALLTLPVSAGVGAFSTWIADTLPFITLDEASLTAIFLGGVAATVAIAYQWFSGWLGYEGFLNEHDTSHADVSRRRRSRRRTRHQGR